MGQAGGRKLWISWKWGGGLGSVWGARGASQADSY